jgi:hypothetical protein
MNDQDICPTNPEQQVSSTATDVTVESTVNDADAMAIDETPTTILVRGFHSCIERCVSRASTISCKPKKPRP